MSNRIATSIALVTFIPLAYLGLQQPSSKAPTKLETKEITLKFLKMSEQNKIVTTY